MKPYAHQTEFVERAARTHFYAWWADPGTGKTIGTLMYCEKYPMKTLVLCPRSVIEDAWVQDAVHFERLEVKSLWHATADKKITSIRSDWDIGVLNFENFVKYQQLFLDVGVRRLVIDESARLKSPKTKITKNLKAFSKKMDSVILLCGEPAPNTPIEYIPQMQCLGPSNPFGDSWMLAAHKYFIPIKRDFGERKVIVRWEPRQDRYAEFVEQIASASWRVSKHECLDLPPIIEQTIHVDMNAAQRTAYAAQVDGIATILGNGPGVVYAPAFQGGLTKLRQIANGYLYLPQHDDGVVALASTKIDAVCDKLDELPPHEPVLIWTQFRYAARMYAEAMKQRGRHVGVLNGETKNPGDIIRSFQKDRMIDTLICHPKSVAHGVTLHRAAYHFWPEYSHSYEEWSQGKARTDRSGQTRKQTVFVFVTRGTVDKVMRRVVEKKGEFSEMVLAHIKQRSTK